MIKAVLFDADGVTITPSGYGSAYAFEQAGLDPKILVPFFSNEFTLCKQGKADVKEEIKPYLDKAGWNKTVDEFLQIWFDYENVIDERMFIEIEKLRSSDVFCALTTDQEQYRRDYVLNTINFKKKFDACYVGCDIGHAKHEQEFFEFVFDDVNKNISVKKNEILLIDDTEHVIDVARQFGFHAELYTNFEDFEKIKSKYL